MNSLQIIFENILYRKLFLNIDPDPDLVVALIQYYNYNQSEIVYYDLDKFAEFINRLYGWTESPEDPELVIQELNVLYGEYLSQREELYQESPEIQFSQLQFLMLQEHLPQYQESSDQESTPTAKHLGSASNVLQFLDQPDIHYEDLGNCLQDVIVERYLDQGAFGSVYVVNYKEKECIMKVVSSKNMTAEDEAIIEAETLKKASDLGIGPKFYDFRICTVTLPEIFGNEKFTIGVFILQKLEKTLKQLFIDFVNEVIPIVDENEYAESVRKQVEIIQNITSKIRKDCIKAHKNGLFITDLHTSNVMLKKNGTPVISDWGKLFSEKFFIECEVDYVTQYFNMLRRFRNRY